METIDNKLMYQEKRATIEVQLDCIEHLPNTKKRIEEILARTDKFADCPEFALSLLREEVDRMTAARTGFTDDPTYNHWTEDECKIFAHVLSGIKGRLKSAQLARQYESLKMLKTAVDKAPPENKLYLNQVMLRAEGARNPMALGFALGVCTLVSVNGMQGVKDLQDSIKNEYRKPNSCYSGEQLAGLYHVLTGRSIREPTASAPSSPCTYKAHTPSS